MTGIRPVSDVLLGVYHITLLSLLGWVAVYDFRYHRIPNPISAVVAGLGFCSVPARVWAAPGPVEGKEILLLLADSLAGALIGGGLLLVTSLLTKGGFGGGDVKLTAGLGLAYGTAGILLVLFVAVAATLFAGIIQRKKRGGTLRLAFAPFLFIGCCMAAYLTTRGF